MSDTATMSLFVSEECNPGEAPIGYYATPKSRLDWRDGNMCRQCDWRAQCNDPQTNLTAYGHRCMSTPVVSICDGKTYRRNDGCSVFFRRKT